MNEMTRTLAVAVVAGADPDPVDGAAEEDGAADVVVPSRLVEVAEVLEVVEVEWPLLEQAARSRAAPITAGSANRGESIGRS